MSELITKRFASENYVNSTIEEILQNLYYVGSVLINSININPSNYLGFGTWELINKGFKAETGSSSSDYISLTENASSYTLSYSRIGQNLKIKILIKTTIEIEDDAVTLGVINFEALGITGFLMI